MPPVLLSKQLNVNVKVFKSLLQLLEFYANAFVDSISLVKLPSKHAVFALNLLGLETVEVR